MNDSRIHRNMKIARDDSAAKLGCSNRCDFPLNASERISEQALIFSLEGRPMQFLRLAVMTGDRHDERAAMDFSMIIFTQTPS